MTVVEDGTERPEAGQRVESPRVDYVTGPDGRPALGPGGQQWQRIGVDPWPGSTAAYARLLAGLTTEHGITWDPADAAAAPLAGVLLLPVLDEVPQARHPVAGVREFDLGALAQRTPPPRLRSAVAAQLARLASETGIDGYPEIARALEQARRGEPVVLQADGAVDTRMRTIQAEAGAVRGLLDAARDQPDPAPVTPADLVAWHGRDAAAGALRRFLLPVPAAAETVGPKPFHTAVRAYEEGLLLPCVEPRQGGGVGVGDGDEQGGEAFVLVRRRPPGGVRGGDGAESGPQCALDGAFELDREQPGRDTVSGHVTQHGRGGSVGQGEGVQVVPCQQTFGGHEGAVYVDARARPVLSGEDAVQAGRAGAVLCQCLVTGPGLPPRLAQPGADAVGFVGEAGDPAQRRRGERVVHRAGRRAPRSGLDAGRRREDPGHAQPREQHERRSGQGAPDEQVEEQGRVSRAGFAFGSCDGVVEVCGERFGGRGDRGVVVCRVEEHCTGADAGRMAAARAGHPRVPRRGHGARTGGTGPPLRGSVQVGGRAPASSVPSTEASSHSSASDIRS
ncbi:hypothetical protein Slala03_71510 [Streptomyces lavendulae subsp. lavendulae]|nr:hypothetical protein Slala03_71510 [Streptomyces lavendulae subsp. lavendulae]